MRVQVHTAASNDPITYLNALFAYQKLDMYCVGFMEDGERKVHKYPMSTLFRTVEDYPVHSHGDGTRPKEARFHEVGK